MSRSHPGARILLSLHELDVRSCSHSIATLLERRAGRSWGTPDARSRCEARTHSGASLFVRLCRESVVQVDGITTCRQQNPEAEPRTLPTDCWDNYTQRPPPPPFSSLLLQLPPIKRGKMLIRAEAAAAPSPLQRKHGFLLKL